MKIHSIVMLSLLCATMSCRQKPTQQAQQEPDQSNTEKPALTTELAENIKKLPFHCITTEYPNTWGQHLFSEEDIKSPKELHAAFYGCYDWHSSVHGHWSLVKLLKLFPQLEGADSIREKLKTNISPANIAIEMEYLRDKRNKSFERPYGWAWELKLTQELLSWDDPLGRELYRNIRPLTDLLVEKFIAYLPTMKNPVRIGTHNNTAFGLCFAWDWADTIQNQALKDAIAQKAKEFYLPDSAYQLSNEPEGADFLSPALEEVDLLSRVLPEQEFKTWLSHFLPELANKNFKLTPGLVVDRTDGQMGHIDGLNFSRAWCLEDLADRFPEYAHLRPIAYQHMRQSIDCVSDGVGGAYEASGHWLGTFALYALTHNDQK